MLKSKYNTISFDSMADLANYMRPDMCLTDGGHIWFGSVTPEQSLAMLKTGDVKQVPAAEKMLSQFDIHIATHGQSMDASVAGFAACVPAYLGWSPESMFDMLPCEDNRSPLKVIVDPSSSAGLDPDVLAQRGTAILAAVMALGATRPVQLEVVAMLDCTFEKQFEREGVSGRHNYCAMRVAVNSTPLDLPSACYALCHQGFSRRVLYGLGKSEFGSPLMWGSVPGVDMRKTREPATIAAMLELLGEDPENTLLIPAAFLHDPIVKDPKKWVSEVLAKYGQPELV